MIKLKELPINPGRVSVGFMEITFNEVCWYGGPCNFVDTLKLGFGQIIASFMHTYPWVRIECMQFSNFTILRFWPLFPRNSRTHKSAVFGCVITVCFGIFVSMKYCKYADEKHSDGSILSSFSDAKKELNETFRWDNGGLSFEKYIMRCIEIWITNNLQKWKCCKSQWSFEPGSSCPKDPCFESK